MTSTGYPETYARIRDAICDESLVDPDAAATAIADTVMRHRFASLAVRLAHPQPRPDDYPAAA